MDFSSIQNEMKFLSQSKNWRKLTKLIDNGYKGIFVILRILQESQDTVYAGEIAKKMNVSTARVASALNTLEKKNYVRRENQISDARKTAVHLTKEGEKALEDRKTEIALTVLPMFENLTQEESSTLFFLVKKLLR